MADAKKANLKEGYKTIRLPRKPNEDAVYVEVNFKGYYIRRGVDIDVPEEVYEAIKASENAEDVAIIFAEQKQDEFFEKAEKSK